MNVYLSCNLNWSAGFKAMKNENAGTISEVLVHDHRRLEELRDRAGRALRTGNSGEAAGVFAQFDKGLRHHIRVEEELLFPALEREGGLRRDFGPTGVMIAEHRTIEGLLERLAREFSGAAGTESAGAAAMDQLTAILEAHDAKEEMVLYPMADRVIGEAGRDSIVAKLRGE